MRIALPSITKACLNVFKCQGSNYWKFAITDSVKFSFSLSALRLKNQTLCVTIGVVYVASISYRSATEKLFLADTNKVISWLLNGVPITLIRST